MVVGGNRRPHVWAVVDEAIYWRVPSMVQVISVVVTLLRVIYRTCTQRYMNTVNV